jgi:hypothetical protein
MALAVGVEFLLEGDRPQREGRGERLERLDGDGYADHGDRTQNRPVWPCTGINCWGLAWENTTAVAPFRNHGLSLRVTTPRKCADWVLTSVFTRSGRESGLGPAVAAWGAEVRFYLNEVPTKGRISNFGRIDPVLHRPHRDQGRVLVFPQPVGVLGLAPHRLR